MINRPLVEVHTADIHFGAMNPRVQYEILLDQMIKSLSTIYFDAFFINGDLFDHKFMANNETIMYAFKFIDDIARLCMDRQATLVLLHGTRSHDVEQLQLFASYTNYIDIRIVESARFELIKGTKVLCLPEEYNKGEEYYNDLLLYTQDYDMAVLHGNIKGAIRGLDQIDLNREGSPVFGLENFRRCNGPIICGHVHVASCYQNHIYYSGSPLRWKFGEESEKGFLICAYNPTTYQYYMHFQPVKSFKYVTYNLSNMMSFTPEAMCAYIKELKNKGIDYIKIKFDSSNAMTSVVKQYFSTYNTIKIDVTDTKFMETISENQRNDSTFDEYAYMLDPNLTPYDIFTRYVNQQKGECFITTEELEQILSSIT